MKMPVNKVLLGACFLAILVSPAKAQPNISDSAFYNTALYNTVAVYHQTAGDQSAILNGRLNVPYLFPFKEGEPYFETSKFRNGSVLYDGIFYENVILLYDELGGLLTTLSSNGRMQFINEKVAAFSIEGSKFIRVVKDSANPMVTGFYQQLYNGKTAILKRNQKSVREVLESSEGVTRFVDEKLLFYFRKADRFFAVKNKSELLDLMQDHKKEIQQFIKKNNLNLKNDKQNSFVRIAEYYDQLTR